MIKESIEMGKGMILSTTTYKSKVYGAARLDSTLIGKTIPCHDPFSPAAGASLRMR
jgi:hypothetical protein